MNIIAMLSHPIYILCILFACYFLHIASSFVTQSTRSTFQFPHGRGQRNNLNNRVTYVIVDKTTLSSSPFDDFLGGLFGNDKDDKSSNRIDNAQDIKDDEEEMSLSSFQQELFKRQQSKNVSTTASTSSTKIAGKDEEEEEEFSGYDLRDIIYYKYGECFDVQFQRVDSYGVRAVYLVSIFISMCISLLLFDRCLVVILMICFVGLTMNRISCHFGWEGNDSDMRQSMIICVICKQR